LGSITAELELVAELSESLSHQEGVVRIGPAPLERSGAHSQWRLIFKYPYSLGIDLAKFLKVEVARISAGKTRIANSGRSSRAVTVKMNDPEVI
jgi:hypothetical protein